MNKIIRRIILVLVASAFLSSCATFVGGSKYYAQILVPKSSAEIIYQGEVMGTGSAFIKMKRKDANKFSFTVRGKGCAPQTYNYTSRAFRGWALAGTIIIWTYYLPWGVGVDLATGALWKPNVEENGIVKINRKNFRYVVNYTGCSVKNEAAPVVDTKVDRVYLKNGSVLNGTLMEPDSVLQIKIQMKDGSIFVFKLDEVLKVE